MPGEWSSPGLGQDGGGVAQDNRAGPSARPGGTPHPAEPARTEPQQGEDGGANVRAAGSQAAPHRYSTGGS